MKIRALIPLFLYLLISGCYEVPYQLSDSGTSIVIPELQGEWIRSEVTVANRGGEASITLHSDSPTLRFNYLDGSGRRWDMDVSLHKIGEKTIASAKKRDGTQQGFAIFLVEFSSKTPDTLVLKTLNENAPRFNSKEGLKNFIMSSESDEHFVRPLTFTRVE